MLEGLVAVIRQAPDLDGPPETSQVDRLAFLLALTALETEWGDRWCAARFEKAYALAGFYYKNSHDQQHLVRKYGDIAACSWGPTQILPVVAYEVGFRGHPWELADPRECIRWSVVRFNQKILQMQVHGSDGWRSVPRPDMDFEKMYRAWNGGNGAIEDPNPSVADYAKRQLSNMARAREILALNGVTA